MIRCKICDEGELLKKKQYRMSGVVVFIGYILLIPSFFGILISSFFLISAVLFTEITDGAIETQAETKLIEADIPELISEQILNSEPVSEKDLDTLLPEQRQIIDEVIRELSVANTVGAVGGVFFGGISIFMFIISIVGGLLGWLLVMKKKVLQCAICGAATPIS